MSFFQETVVSIYEVKIHCCCKLLEIDAGGETSYLTSSKLSVRPAQHHTAKKDIIIIITKVIGRNCFHVSLINLS